MKAVHSFEMPVTTDVSLVCQLLPGYAYSSYKEFIALPLLDEFLEHSFLDAVQQLPAINIEFLEHP